MGQAAESDRTSMDAERRPVRSRQWVVLQRVGMWLAQRGIKPNAISVASIVFALCGAVLTLWASYHTGWLLRLACIGAAVCVQLRLLSNVLDGIVAERLTKASPAGRLYNEWPDRVSDVLLLVGFGSLAVDGAGLTLGLLAACLAVMTAYVRELGRAVDAPGVFLGPMAKPQRMAVLTVALLAIAAWPVLARKVFWGPGAAYGFVEAVLVVITAGCILTAVRRLRHLHRHAALQGADHDHE